jgi:ribonuclease-3
LINHNLSIIDKKRLLELEKIQTILNIRFQNLDLLNTAFTHKSFTNENKYHKLNNERLEFLGDSVLGLVISNYLYHKFPKSTEGSLSKIKSKLVSGVVLADVIKKMNISKYILFGTGEKKLEGEKNPKILENLFESIIGAIYLDLGFRIAEEFILSKLIYYLNENYFEVKNYMSFIQEYTQKKFKSLPNYVLLEETGPDHSKYFKYKIETEVDSAIGEGENKQKAKQNAAKNLALKLGIKPNV